MPIGDLTNGFSLAIKIRLQTRITVIPFQFIKSLQIFAHAPTTPPPCEVQIVVVITVLED